MNKLKFPNSVEFIDTYFPTVDGVVRTVHNYARLINEESYACVVAPEQNGEYTDDFSYEVFRVHSVKLPVAEYRLPDTVATRTLELELDERNPQIFHVHSPFLLGRYAVREAHRRGIPCVATFHSKYYDDTLKITGSKLIAKLVTRGIIRFYDKCDSIWACSEGTAQTLRSYGYKGPIFVVDNGTDYKYPENPEALKAKALEYLGIEKDTPVLLFIGHQIWQKNLKLVLDTSRAMADKGFNFKTVIVGAGYAAKSIKDYAAELKLENNVIFTGQITDKELLQGLELVSSIFFFPSVYDNSPLVVREAAAMGLPAMLMRGSNSTENTQDGVNAFHCDNDANKTAERLITLLSDKKTLEKVGEAAKNTLGRPWEEIMPRVREKYWEVINEYKARHGK